MLKYAIVAAGLVLSLVLGATLFREPIAWAAQAVDANIIGPLDAGGNVKVHEQGTANVNVTNGSLKAGSYPTEADGFFQRLAVLFPFQNRPLLEGPLTSSEELRITSFTIDNINDGEAYVSIGGLQVADTDKACPTYVLGDLHVVLVVAVPAHGTLQLPFPQPLSIVNPGFSHWCLEAFMGTDVSSSNDANLPRVTTIGYIR
jgi:hypothetical protein